MAGNGGLETGKRTYPSSMPESHTQLQENKWKEGEAEEKTKLL